MLGGIAQQCRQRVYTLEDIAVGCRVLRLPCRGLCLTYRGITTIGNTTCGVGGSIVTLAGVRDISTQARLQFQLRDDGPLSEASTYHTGILRLSLGILQIADGVAHFAIVDIHAGGGSIVVIRSVSIVDRGVRRVRDSSEPRTWLEHVTTVVGDT